MLQYPLLSRRLFTTAASPPSSIATITSALRALDIRLGHVRTVTAHPDADRLFVEQIDVGHIDSVQNRTSEDSATVEQRQIVSGLRAFMQVEDLCDRRVLVVCGMKRRK